MADGLERWKVVASGSLWNDVLRDALRVTARSKLVTEELILMCDILLFER